MPLGTPSLTATTDPSGFVQLVAQCSGADTVTIQRVSASGSHPVRGAVDADISSGALVVSDWEIPQALSYSYVATVTGDGTTVSTDPVEAEGIDRGGDYIAALGAPFSGTLINVESLTQEERTAQQDVVTVLGRPDPVVVTFGRTWMRGDLVLISLTDAERNALENIFADGRLILFQPRIGVGYDDPLILAAANVTVERVSTNAYEPARRWTVEVQRIEAPPATFTIPVGTTWQARVDSGATWSYWSSTGTWLDLAGVG